MQEAWPRFVHSEEELAERLRELSALLRTLSSDDSQTIQVRRESLRYAPFLEVMALSEQFVDALLRIGQVPGSSVTSVRWELAPFVERYRLPTDGRYSVETWVNLLERAFVPRLEVDLPLRARYVDVRPWGLEVHFVYPEPSLRSYTERPASFLFAQRIPEDESEREVRDRLKGPVRNALQELKGHVSRLESRLFMPQNVSVRVALLTAPLSLGSKEPPPWDAIAEASPRRWLRIEQIDIFSFEWVRGERIEKTTTRMLKEILASLRGADLLAVPQGRKPESESLARYWKAIALEGMTVAELAVREAGNDGDGAIDLEDTIQTQLRRHGIKIGL